MPTFKILVGKQKEDTSFPIYIQLTQNRIKKYLPTGHYVVKNQLKIKKTFNKNGEIKEDISLKEDAVSRACSNILEGYREKLLKYPNVTSASADQIKAYLLKEETTKQIDFIAHAKKFIKGQAESTGKNTETVINAFVDFLGYDILDIKELNLKLLQSFAQYLQSERIVKRKGGNNNVIEYKLKPVSNTAINDYIGKLRQIFINARDEYNDEDSNRILIAHYPFRKFKMPKIKAPKKRNLKSAEIKLIRDAADSTQRGNMARDVFMLSFYHVGINSADLFKLDAFKDGRISYNRSKTESRKEENSFISIKVESEALPLFEKYKDHTGKRIFNFYHNYVNADAYNKAVNKGLKEVAKSINAKKNVIEPELNLGYARGSWATIARNECKVSKEDIHFALNHSDPDMKVTDLYIEEDFSIVDEANRKVLDTLL